MRIKPTILNIAGAVQIIYSVVYYYINGRKGDGEGWGMLATIILVAFGIGAILIDWLLRSTIKNTRILFLIELIIVIAAWFFIYKY